MKMENQSSRWLLVAMLCLSMACSSDEPVAGDEPVQDAAPIVTDAVASMGDATGPVSDAEMVVEDAGMPDGGMSLQHPNVVLIVADDLGWNDVGYHGSEIETPRIDQLVREGVALDRFYTSPLCGPTRKGLMTGRSPVSIGVLGNARPNDYDALPLDEHLMSETLQNGGFQTWIVGKWHLGGAVIYDYLPYHRGFDHFYGFVGAFIDHYSHRSTRSNEIDWQRNGETIEEMGYATDLLTDEALELMENRDTTRPFFLFLSYNAVHTPLMAPDNLVEKYSFIDQSNRQTYAAMVDAMDTNIGRVMDAIAAAGIDEETLVIFHSDNGGDIAMGGASNSPFRGAKSQPFEGGIRVAGAMRWPGVIEAGRNSNQFFSVLDVFPTVAGAAGLNPENTLPLDGRNLWDAIQNDEVLPPHEYVVTANGIAIIHGDWKLIRTRQGGELLFRIEEDPSEENDVAGDNPEVMADLNSRLDRLLADVQDQLN
jgi:arylsulfatase A-like enzyme